MKNNNGRVAKIRWKKESQGGKKQTPVKRGKQEARGNEGTGARQRDEKTRGGIHTTRRGESEGLGLKKSNDRKDVS